MVVHINICITIKLSKMADFVGDYSLKHVFLSNKDKILDIKELIAEVNIYESINSANISADIVVSDNKNILESFPIVGGEFLTIYVGTNSDNYTLDFVVYKIDSKAIQEKSQVYILRLCTKDTITNETSRFSRRFKRKFSETIVKDLLKNYIKTTKKIDVDQSIYPLNFVNPNWRIFDLITWMARKSTSIKNVQSVGYLFYETLQGYHYKSIDVLFSQRSKNENKPFTYVPAKTTTDADKNYRIVKYISESYFDVLEQSRMGALSHYTERIDFGSRTKTLTKSTLSSIWKHMSHLGGGNIPNHMDNEIFNQPSRIIYTPIINQLFGESIVFDGDDDKINKLIDRSVYRYISMDFFTINIEIPGNLGIRAGDVYTLNIPSPNPDSNANRNRQTDNGLSGNWMCHSIKTQIGRTSATSIVRLCRDSVGGTKMPITGTFAKSINNVDRNIIDTEIRELKNIV